MKFQRVTAFAVALALAMPLSAFRETRNPRRTVDGMAARVVAAMNAERAAHGLAPLRINDQLSLAASDRISDMFSKHYFNHVSPDGIEPWKWAEKEGYDYHEIGENLAVGYRTPDDIVEGWMESPGHRANVLKKNFDEVGVAIAGGSPEQRFHGPTVVALYGER